MEIMKSVREAIRNPHAWPGDFDKFGITNNGELICNKCLKIEHSNIANDTIKGRKSKWSIAAIDCECSQDGATCDNCGEKITDNGSGNMPNCENCGNNRQVWVNQITGLLTCHRYCCQINITQKEKDR